jgi:uncharacterized protein YjaG (DUF416 family)
MSSLNADSFQDVLHKRLAVLTCQKIVAFAASCSERLMPAYIRYSKRAGLSEEQSKLYRDALDMLWGFAVGSDVKKQYLEQVEGKCLSSIPTEDETWAVGEPYAEDAGAAVTYAIRACLSCNPQEAVWAAQRVIDAIDSFVSCQEEILAVQSNSENGEHRLIDKELARQEADLQELEMLVESPLGKDIMEKIRNRAQQHGELIFS